MADLDLLKYSMDNPHRGIAMVFSYRHFSQEQNFAERSETDIDCSMINRTLTNYGFNVCSGTTKPKDANKLTKEDTLGSIDKGENSDKSYIFQYSMKSNVKSNSTTFYLSWKFLKVLGNS